MVHNCLMWLEFSSLGIQTPSAHLHWLATLHLHQITPMIFQSWQRSSGQRLSTKYGTLLGPGAEADLAPLITSWTSFKLGSLRLKSTLGGGGLMGASCRLSAWTGFWESGPPPLGSTRDDHCTCLHAAVSQNQRGWWWRQLFSWISPYPVVCATQLFAGSWASSTQCSVAWQDVVCVPLLHSCAAVLAS